MTTELAIYVTAFAIITAGLLLSGKRELRNAAAQKRKNAAEIDALVRPVLLFTTTTPVAHC
ncbi:hypothetical protein [Vitiosangium sp. GDMCC 1.1324]|uniref:hypothetical protein n=1 Tax=Vitiosangium sp. (strain GDMCC 1.1324) TaxID=2138576 RepID=UPI000D38F76C|nr:hypothetical protein [Vitiosangium sp. GDMCC 1.1324]PTL78331.1 hypothetical protein DAT35_40500 [Vitiosangium sp. GDMCC 1.1324]